MENWKVDKCLVCDSSNIRDDYDYPNTMQNCDQCGSEWNCELEVTLNAKEID